MHRQCTYCAIPIDKTTSAKRDRNICRPCWAGVMRRLRARKATDTEWMIRTTGANNHRNALLRAQRHGALDPNADRESIKALYLTAARLTAITNSAYHVDHIVSLSNGGRHTPENLCVMRGDINFKKRNLDWPWLQWINSTFSWGESPFDA